MNKLEPLKKIEDRAYLTRTFEDSMIHMGISLKCNDRMNMAKSIELKVPFFDTRLIDFAMHLPAYAKYRDGITKFLLKKLKTFLKRCRLLLKTVIFFTNSQLRKRVLFYEPMANTSELDTYMIFQVK
ncbi:MAG: hypothetical protein GVY20_10970 [Bacteroidetes bacterium]|jgi:asparagine synthetase B (glutamine-hydrolysing)|nr:hypothetical protein [Bacteroidota bacterium]